MSKHLINNKDDWAREGIKGYLYANNTDLIALEEFPNVVLRRDYQSLQGSSSRVAILCGGGSGHEPAHLGFIGQGMLTGVVCGNLFASPSTSAILAAIRFVGKANNAGVLLIVKNYTGDRLNFGLATKRAQLEGINVDWILVDDDVALLEHNKPINESVGSRGLCGTVLIEKIAGALAEQRLTLKEIKQHLEYLLDGHYLRTLGVSLSGRVTLPGEAVKAQDELIEVGLGIHGETGRKKMPLTSSAKLAELVLNEHVLNFDQNSAKDVCLMVNNLGGLSNLEICLFANDCVKYMQSHRADLSLRRLYCGTFMTSLNMNGFSVTSVLLDEAKLDFYLNLLDAPTTAPAWPKSCGKDLKVFEYTSFNNLSGLKDLSIDNTEYIEYKEANSSEMLKYFMQTICQDLIDLKEYLNKLDSGCGDGDCGDSMFKLSEAILLDIENNKFDFKCPHQVFSHCSVLLENGGGSLCILLALFFSAAAKAFHKSSIATDAADHLHWHRIWLQVLELGIGAVQEYGRAKPNQRSIIDPLTSLRQNLLDYIKSVEVSAENQLEANILLKFLVDSTYKSAESTAGMVPRVGRASYVDYAQIATPDAGAIAVSSVINSIYKAYLINKNL